VLRRPGQFGGRPINVGLLRGEGTGSIAGRRLLADASPETGNVDESLGQLARRGGPAGANIVDPAGRGASRPGRVLDGEPAPTGLKIRSTLAVRPASAASASTALVPASLLTP